MKKIYDDAISYYTKAIDNSEKNEDELHVYYSNSTSYHLN